MVVHLERDIVGIHVSLSDFKYMLGDQQGWVAGKCGR